MIGNDGGGDKINGAEVIPKTWGQRWIWLVWRTLRCHRWSRKGETGGGGGRAGWLDGEQFAKVRGLGGPQGVVG